MMVLTQIKHVITHHIIIFYLALSMVTSVLACPLVAYAEGMETSQPVDVLLLVDQSGSMGGAPFGMPASVVERPNDPDGLRFAAPLAALNILGLDRLGLHRGAEYRFGVVSFGGPETERQARDTFVEASLPLTLINPSNSVEWDTLQRVVKPAISGDQWALQKKNLGSTSFIEPFELACQQLSASSLSQSRTRLVILITDGRPQHPYKTIDPSEHLKAVKAIVDRCGPLKTALIHVVGLNDFDNPRWFDTVEELWTDVTGSRERVGLIASNQQLHQKVASILSTAIPWGEKVRQQTAVPAYLDRVIFRVFKTGLNDEVRFYPPGASTSDFILCGKSGIECSGTGELTEIITIPFPRSGMWRVEVVRGKDVEVWKTTVPLTVAVETPPELVQFSKTTLRIQLLAQSGQVWRPRNDPQARVEWNCASLDIGAKSYPVQPIETNDGFELELSLADAGSARLKLCGTTNGFNEVGVPRRVPIAISTSVILPDVVPGTLATVRVETVSVDGGEAGSIYWTPFWLAGAENRPVRLTMRLESENGVMLPIRSVFDGDLSAKVSISGPDGDDAFTLNPDGDSWSLVAPMGVPGQYIVTPSFLGTMRKRVALQPFLPTAVERTAVANRPLAISAQVVLTIGVAAAAIWAAVGFVRARFPPLLIGTITVSAMRPSGEPRTRVVRLDRNVNYQRFSIGAQSSAFKWIDVRRVKSGGAPTLEVVVQPRHAESRRRRIADGQSFQWVAPRRLPTAGLVTRIQGMFGVGGASSRKTNETSDQTETVEVEYRI